MSDKYIYFVGKPYPHSSARMIIRRFGYKVGLLLDKNIPIKNTEDYDRVIEVDFSSEQSLFTSITDKNLQINGLICTYENYIVAKAKLSTRFSLPSLSREAAEMCTDKYLMRQAFMLEDPTITPRYNLVKNEADLIEIANELSYPLILKPTNLVKSLLVLRCNNKTELMQNYRYARQTITQLYERYKIYDRQPQLIVEEYILGKTCSIAAFIDHKGVPHFCEGIVTLTNAQDIGLDDNFIYCRQLPGKFSEDLRKRLYETAQKGISALKMTSVPAHVELIYNDTEVKLIEIGARIGGYRPRMYELSYGLDLIEQEVRLAVDQAPSLGTTLKSHSAVYELFPAHEGKFISVDGLRDVSEFTYFSIKAKPGQLVGPAKNGYKSAAVVIVSNPDERKFKKLCYSVDQMKVTTKL